MINLIRIFWQIERHETKKNITVTLNLKEFVPILFNKEDSLEYNLLGCPRKGIIKKISF